MFAGIDSVTTKIFIIGDSGVGKTNLLFRFKDNSFHPDQRSTIGVDLITKTLKIDGKDVTVNIWDTAGQEKFQSTTTTHYRGSHAAIIAYDVTNRESYTRVTAWLKELRAHTTDSADFPIILLGNKTDEGDKRQVTHAVAARLAEEQGFKHFFEVSAKDGTNVTNAFQCLAEAALTYKISTETSAPEPATVTLFASLRDDPGETSVTTDNAPSSWWPCSC